METELKRLARRAIAGWRDVKPRRLDEQTLVYPFSPQLAALAVDYLRTPSRAWWDLYASRAMRLEPLFEELVEWAAADDRGWIAGGFGLSVEVRATAPFPAGPLQIQGTVKNAVIEGARRRGVEVHLDAERPDLILVAHGAPPVISVDLGGGSLHQRGWRLSHGEAPLRETLAAQILILAGWDPRSEVLVDPMCGSGTIPIEAALLARAEPRWLPPRRPLAERLPAMQGLERTLRPLYPDAAPAILGSDVDPAALKDARANAARSGASDRVTLLERDFRALRLAELAQLLRVDAPRGLVVVNPPYGERLTGADLDPLYADLAAWYRALGPGWRAAFLVADDRLERNMKGRPTLKKPLPNGPLKTKLLVYGPTGDR
jgi:23S rRNA G2445 N2-methylase RlmL